MATSEQDLETGLVKLKDDESADAEVARSASSSSDSGDADQREERPATVDAATRESWLAAFRTVARARRGGGSGGGGGIRPGQLGDALRLAGFVVTEAEVAQYRADAADPEGGGSIIGADAFLALAERARREIGGAGAGGDFEKLRAALAVFDKRLSGRISAGDLRHWLTSLGEPIDEGDVARMLEHLVDDQGLLDYTELAHRLAGI